MVKRSLKMIAGLAAISTITSGCAILQPEDTGLGENIVVSSSEEPPYEPKDVDNKEITSDLGAKVKDDGLNVEWELQGVYSDSVQGSVVTIKLHNLNDQALPVDAFEDPVLERADGNGGWSKIELLPYNAATNPDVAAPGLDLPLGAGASTNLQYRFNVAPGNLWNARFTIGNVTYVGDLNL